MPKSTWKGRIELVKACKFDDVIRSWVWTRSSGESLEDYKRMTAAHARDRKELRSVKNLFVAGKFDEARRRADYLDTIVRDRIPSAVWDVLYAEQV